MTYQEFQQFIVTKLQEHFDASASVSIRPIRKNNNVVLDGLTILEEGINVSPTIYLNTYYEAYKDGQSPESLLTDILKLYDANRPTDSIDIRFYTDFDNISNRILFKLIHYDKNEALLAEIPHFRYLDLAIVFYCLISTTPTGSATILIKNSHLSYWNISKENLLQYAKENTPRLLPHTMQTLSSLLEEYGENLTDEDDSDNSRSHTIYVLSNRRKLYGACCMLYPNLLKETAKRLGSGLYILPSSIHEVLLIPATKDINPSALNLMVREVNDTQVADEEILADHIYYYSLTNEALTVHQSLV